MEEHDRMERDRFGIDVFGTINEESALPAEAPF
jgi:hypothetical protein